MTRPDAPRRAPHPRRKVVGATLAGAVALALVACSSSGDDASPTAGDAGGSSGSGSATSSASDASSTSDPSTTPAEPQPSSCVQQTADALTPTQQAGQLLMVALQPGDGERGLDRSVRRHGVGSMLYLGGWEGASTVRSVSDHLQQIAPRVGGATVGMLVAADQEGGEVQQLTGPGFDAMPSGIEQAGLTSPALRAAAEGWGDQLRAAGVNVNLSPVADTVPDDIGTANDPIGRYGRQYGSTPASASRGAVAFAQGMRDARVEPTVKHFPGLGRISGNTDLTAEGITDTVATTDDPHLTPFADAIDDGARIVMVGSARYPRLDPDQPALFSEAIVTDLLRDRLGFDGVVVTDDVGAAAAVAAWPVGERATRFVDAGGDIVLTAQPAQVPTMVSAITREAQGDPDFATKVDDAVLRVLTLKEDMGLLRCG